MSALYPPILESQRSSIPSYKVGDIRANFIIPITLPMSVEANKIGHFQILIRRQIDMAIWSEQGMKNTPEKEVIYLENNNTTLIDNNTKISIPANLTKPFLAGNLISDKLINQTGRMYTIQVRFGDEPITTWMNGTETFANWKATQIADSKFGEWSNTQRMFCYALPVLGKIFNATIINDVIGRLDWQYSPISEDPVSEVRLTYSWSTPDGSGNTLVAKNIGFSNSNGQTSGSFGSISFDIMRFAKITFTLILTTINDSVFEISQVIPGIINPNGSYIFPVDTNAANRIQRYPIVGEEIEDGVLAMSFTGTYRSNTTIHATETVHYNLYRVDVVTLETILLSTIRGTGAFTETIRDYSIEMGAEYVYIAVSYGNITGKVHYLLVPLSSLTPTTWNPPLYSGYGRQMNFNSNLFITSKFQQLRMQGNVILGSFQRNTSDQITTTIGSKFPFYSRASDYNYRSFNLQGLITLNFDTTHTFLKFKSQQSQVVVDAKNDAASRYQISVWKLNQNPGLDYAQKIAELQGIYYSELRMIYEGRDPITNAKLPIDWMTGQLWFVKNKDNDQIELRTTDLFSMNEYSLSRKRVQDRHNKTHEWIDSLDNLDGYLHDPIEPHKYIDQATRVRGATSEYDNQKMRDVTEIIVSDRQNNLIYAERKFRDAVMSWLSDGTPKLIRSETEGNMIAVLTNVSFAPFDKSRQLYSVNATVTEISEANLSNLILYSLVPVDFQPFYIPGIEFDFMPGSVDANITTAN